MATDLFYPRFMGLHSGDDTIDKNHASDCMNWINSQGKLDQHGPRLASKALLTSAVQDSNAANAPIRLMPSWIDTAGNRREFYIVEDATDGNYEGIYQREDAGHVLASASRAWGTPMFSNDGASTYPKTLTMNTKYYFVTPARGDGFFLDSSIATGDGIAIAGGAIPDLQYYRSVTWPSITYVASGAAQTTYEVGFRVGFDGDDVSYGTHNFAATPTWLFAAGTNTSFGRCGTEEYYLHWIKPTIASPIYASPTDKMHLAVASGTFLFNG